MTMPPISILEKLLQLAQGAQLPASKLRHKVTNALIDEDIILERYRGHTHTTLYITDTTALNNWLHNNLSINNLGDYISARKNEDITRAGLVAVSNDSKTISKRSFKGFLVNSYAPVECLLNGNRFVVDPTPGIFQFVYDFESFVPAADVVIVGVENAENFRWIEKQQHLFKNIKALFVSRYPQEQGKDLVKWLKSIPNRYVHFGDFDFAGINIYLQEYKKYFDERASFFIPDNLELLLEKHGNRKLYDQQRLNAEDITEDNLQLLISLLHKYKKGLEQEALLI